MMHIQARSYASGAEMIAARKAVRNRLLNPQVRKPVLPVGEPDIVLKVIVGRPLWQTEDIQFDAHEKSRNKHMFDIRTHTEPRAYLKKRCEELGFKRDDITGPSRIRVLIEPRHLLMWEIKQKFPHVSLPQIGRMFGGRDHTTVLNALGRVENIRAMESA